MLQDQQTYQVISWSDWNFGNYDCPNLVENVNFFVFWKLSLLRIFTLTTYSKYKHFNVAYYTFPFIMKIFGTFYKQKCSGLTSNSITVFVVFGQYCLSLSAIISIIKRDNRLLHGCLRMLKRLSICTMPSISTQMPNSGRIISLKICRL